MLKMLAKGAISNWITGELVRVYHNLTTAQAERLADALVEVSFPQCEREMTASSVYYRGTE